jgi:hypothetical protein
VVRKLLKDHHKFVLTKTGLHNALKPGGVWDSIVYCKGGAGLYYGYQLIKHHDVYENMIGGMNEDVKLDSSAAMVPAPNSSRKSAGRNDVITHIHDHGKRAAELELVEIEKCEDEALNLLHSRQSELMNQKALARAAGDTDDIQYFQGELIMLREKISLKTGELDNKRAKRQQIE